MGALFDKITYYKIKTFRILIRNLSKPSLLRPLYFLKLDIVIQVNGQTILSSCPPHMKYIAYPNKTSIILKSLHITLFFLYFLVTGFSKGYAFVEYRNERDANMAWRVSEVSVNNLFTNYT